MQVRKFEARNIKEAIDLVKFHMGPDAIILSAKENVKGFGLMGQASVEVTAAISETKLRQKAIAESKLDSRTKQKFIASPAQTQKKFIEKVFQEQPSELEAQQQQRPTARRQAPITAVRYADIPEEGEIPEVTEQQAVPTTVARAPLVAAVRTVPAVAQTSAEEMALKREIGHLKGLLEQFQKVPQNFMTLHPGAEDGLPYELSFAFKKLIDAGMSKANVVKILRAANDSIPAEQKKKKAFIDGWLIKYLLERIDIVEEQWKKQFHVFVGPTGQGKTSVMVKIACHLMMKEKKKIALVTGDSIKVGAPDQMKIYAQILNVPCAMLHHASDWAPLIKAFQNVDYILIDTPGLTLKGTRDLDIIRALIPPVPANTSTHYVQSIMARDTDAFEIAERYQVLGFDDVIFTRLDEAVQHGLAYNFHKKFEVPIHSFGTGHNIPEDYEPATKERMVDLLFNISNFRKGEA